MGQGASVQAPIPAVVGQAGGVEAAGAGGEAQRRKRRRSSSGDSDTDDATPENIRDNLDTPSKKRVKSTSRYIYDTLFVEGRSSDVTVVALGREWHLHRVYLCQADYFGSMFNGSWEESSLGRIEISIVDENITEEALTITFGALYSDVIQLAPSKVASVLAAASMFQLRGLLDEVAKFMMETIASDTVCTYHAAAQMYGSTSVCKRCEEWLHLHLLKSFSVELFRCLSQEMLIKLLHCPDLFVLQVEMDIYTVLKQWLYIQLHMDYEDECNKLLKISEGYFKRRCDEDSEKRAFLETADGEPYVELFKSIRLRHVVGDVYSCTSLENDGIVPKSWLFDVYREQWLVALSSEQKNDSGPASVTDDWFNENSMRFGRVLPEESDYCWRWVGYSFGFDMVASYRQGRLSIRRNTGKFPCSRSVTLQQEHRELVLRVQALWEETDADSQLMVTKTLDSSRMNFYFRPDEEATVLNIPTDSVTFPLFISFRVAFVGPLE